MKLVFLIFSIWICTPSFAQNRVQHILNTYKDSLQGYGMVALVDDGIRLDTASIGVSHPGEPIGIDHRFCIGSCTKMFTAALILKLHEAGLLHIQDSLSQYLPVSEYIDPSITIQQLLNHTSGLDEFTKDGFVNTPILEPYGDYSDSKILARLDTVQFEKGMRYQYCNTNYLLLRKIIEVVTDQPYELALRAYIIKPLGLENFFSYYSNQIDQLAHPIIGGQDLQDYPKFGINTISRGIGNLVCDAKALNQFIRALFFKKTILNQETLELMTELYAYKDTKVGLGIFEEFYGGRRVLGHTGRQVSYIAYAFVDPNTGESFVILTNNANDHYIDLVMGRLCSHKP